MARDKRSVKKINSGKQSSSSPSSALLEAVIKFGPLEVTKCREKEISSDRKNEHILEGYTNYRRPAKHIVTTRGDRCTNVGGCWGYLSRLLSSSLLGPKIGKFNIFDEEVDYVVCQRSFLKDRAFWLLVQDYSLARVRIFPIEFEGSDGGGTTERAETKQLSSMRSRCDEAALSKGCSASQHRKISTSTSAVAVNFNESPGLPASEPDPWILISFSVVNASSTWS
ncbi:hypothetical protein BDN70DRAFT_897634 [Pholiota conissans]|uniref:Uncharacterized protein n=1 Tax=Pholiota conissans TaxID=109636 RepID=A0A9P5YUN2_9AGAR|nr:hypothetical protein BDN70DRAFT_897634 [Pholiota conissans]